MKDTYKEDAIKHHFDKGMPYTIITKHGHEYNGFLDYCDEGWFIGKVAKKKVVTLHDPGNGVSGLEVSVDNEDQAKKKFENSKDIYIQELCYVKHETQTIRVSVSEIFILEDAWRKPVTIKPDGKVDEELLVKNFPEFGEYRMVGGGFCTNPSVRSLRMITK
jgi:hypothetical protein